LIPKLHLNKSPREGKKEKQKPKRAKTALGASGSVKKKDDTDDLVSEKEKRR